MAGRKVAITLTIVVEFEKPSDVDREELSRIVDDLRGTGHILKAELVTHVPTTEVL